jgi:hypothetical protein
MPQDLAKYNTVAVKCSESFTEHTFTPGYVCHAGSFFFFSQIDCICFDHGYDGQ